MRKERKEHGLQRWIEGPGDRARRARAGGRGRRHTGRVAGRRRSSGCARRASRSPARLRSWTGWRAAREAIERALGDRRSLRARCSRSTTSTRSGRTEARDARPVPAGFHNLFTCMQPDVNPGWPVVGDASHDKGSMNEKRRARVRSRLLFPGASIAVGLASCSWPPAATTTTAERATSPARSRSTARARSGRSPRRRPRLFREENPDVKITVGISGTGGGFEKFCAGETDISDASRPIEPEEEVAGLQEEGHRATTRSRSPTTASPWS